MSKLYEEYKKSYDIYSHLNGKCYLDTVGDLYFRPEIQRMSEYEQHLEIDRLQHMTSVSYLSFLICRRLKLDYRSAARASIMHDLVFYDWRNPDEMWHRPHGYLHPKFAAENAKILTGGMFSPKEEKIVLKHMFPLTVTIPSSREGLIVSLSDKYCATRELCYSLSKTYKKRFLKEIGRNV